MGLDALVVLEQVAPGRFVSHSLESVTCDHATCDLSDFDADGKIDLVTGNFLMPESPGSKSNRSTSDSIILFKNLGRVSAETATGPGPKK